ncbi:P-loop NTPase family protein [Nakamurella lactea]|uniref:recombinase RecA n=1 Tax=Nakamurella lactea TaxID=459515 RepID=UPI001377EF77|nr:recombinase RecA [Nakamurella lactea]
MAALLAGELPDPPRPEVLTRDDGRAIFYAGQVNALFADAESGKTMVTCAAIQEVLKIGGRAVFVDIDHNGMAGIVTRLLDLGCRSEDLSDPDRFRYVEPEDKAQLLDLVAFLVTWRPTLVVVDSVGELLPMFRLSSNNPDDFTTVHAEALKPLAMAGACVITVDHVAKNVASAESGPTGTNAKRRAVGGVSIRVKVKDQFVPGHGGAVWLMVNKDRHGGLREHCPRGDREPSAGLFTLTPTGTGMTWNLRAPQDTDSQQIASVASADLAALDALDPAPANVRDVKERMNWRSERAAETLRVWRSRSRSVPGERGTSETANVPRSPTPVLGTGNTVELRPCGHPTGQTPGCIECLIADREGSAVA